MLFAVQIRWDWVEILSVQCTHAIANPKYCESFIDRLKGSVEVILSDIPKSGMSDSQWLFF